MSAPPRLGAELICDALERAGIEYVFGLPGTQNVPLYDALRTSGLRTVVATHELSAAMMVNGYYRSSGRLAALLSIPGPGFTWAMTGLAEAFLDSAALVYLVGKPATSPGTRYQLQAIDQAAMASPVVKAIHRIGHAQDIAGVLQRACAHALATEPGPVLVEVAREALDERTETIPEGALARVEQDAVDSIVVDEAASILLAARRCVILAGQGAHAAAKQIEQLAERLSAGVVTTTSGRGVVAEDHPLSLAFALGDSRAEALNTLIEASDCVLAIGCKFSHNGSRGFGLRIPQDKLIHVDASPEVLGANYPARLEFCSDAGAFATALLRELETRTAQQTGFGYSEIEALRSRARELSSGRAREPRIHGVTGGRPEAFFAALRRAMPRQSCLVTDSGLHQSLARRYFRVLHPRGLLTPTNLQSMGFAIGAAIGAGLADRNRPVVALVGDGGLAMSGMELLTAVRQRLNLTVIVFVDGAYGLIRAQQLARTGHAHGTEFSGPDVAALAVTVGAEHVRLHDDAETALRTAINSQSVNIVEVAVGDTLPMHWMRAKSIVRGRLGENTKSWLRGLRRK